MDNQSIQHTRWNCTYHIVFIPKYRRKIMYGSNKKDIVEVIKKLCEIKGVALIEGKVCVDHVNMYVSIPPKIWRNQKNAAEPLKINPNLKWGVGNFSSLKRAI